MARAYSVAAAGWCHQIATHAPAHQRALHLAAMQFDMAQLGFGGMERVQAWLDLAVAAGLTLERLEEMAL